MKALLLTLSALLAVSCLASSASANGGLGISANIHHRAQNRQQQRQNHHHHGAQLNFLAPHAYYAPAQLRSAYYVPVQPIVAEVRYVAPPQPIVREIHYAPAQPILSAPVCEVPLTQGYSQGFTQTYRQNFRQRQVNGGCSQFFRQNNFAY